jgi:hypothetical protein
MRASHIALAITLSLAAGSAMAQTGLGYLANKADVAMKNFEAADRNHDGLLSKEEAQAGKTPFIAKHFEQIDREHRGQVSKEDVAAYVKSLRRPAPASAASAPAKP